MAKRIPYKNYGIKGANEPLNNEEVASLLLRPFYFLMNLKDKFCKDQYRYTLEFLHSCDEYFRVWKLKNPYEAELQKKLETMIDGFEESFIQAVKQENTLKKIKVEFDEHKMKVFFNAIIFILRDFNKLEFVNANDLAIHRMNRTMQAHYNEKEKKNG